ncbi:porin family protein [Leeuwenhoekiella parthenopeia]|uniref:PorT family protein n=1 Tax=Leeuwenhoekiella parthenopeia TaxID=2890320 RepID=A0ABS8GXF3_9FLAO|nr:porin family protein [Leeuwenhoekiella parthenopeia]MCC4214694.1 PorT family protein [Leeuwenhoekiella parthenopeia]
MKKPLLFILFIVLGLNSALAQRGGDLQMGLSAGLNLSNVSTMDGENNTDPRISFNLAASGEYFFSESWAIRAKLIYDNKGWANGFIEDNNFNSYTTDFRLNYITLPVMASWHFSQSGNWYLNLGPYVGFLINATDSELGSDVKEVFNSTDFGVAFGIGYAFDISRDTRLFVEYDAQTGFHEIFKINDLGQTIRNGRSSVNFGVLFYLN